MSQEARRVEEGELSFLSHRMVFEAAPDALLIVDGSGVIRDVNAQALRLLGYERGELSGRLVEDLVPSEARGRHVHHRSRYMEDPQVRPMGIGMELRALRKDGRQVPVEISLSPCSTPQGEFTIAAVRDVSERKRLRRLGAGTLKAAEEERRRIARELHDDTAQCLAAILLQLRVLRGTSDAQAREGLLDEMHEELTSAVEGVRRISRGLRPPALEDVGVAAAIRSHVRGVVERSGLQATLDLEPVDGFLDPDAQLVVYRVVQEAVTNVVRHASAESVRIGMAREHEEVVVRVTDDGCGFDLEGTLVEGGGLGLLGMDERARLMGGRLRIHSVPGEGTQVQLSLPVQVGSTHGWEEGEADE